MNVASFYHAWADGRWEEPLEEHLAALLESGFDGPLYFGLVGKPERRAEVAARVRDVLRRPFATVEASDGFEQVTLRAAWAYAREHDGAVLYAHTKGAYRTYAGQVAWRRLLTDVVVRPWRENAELLRDHDAVGHCWFDERANWDPAGFGGNFWIARCDYLRTLPDPGTRFAECWDQAFWENSISRGQAEVWVGCGRPRVVELADWKDGQGPPVPVFNGSTWEVFMAWLGAYRRSPIPAPTSPL